MMRRDEKAGRSGVIEGRLFIRVRVSLLGSPDEHSGISRRFWNFLYILKSSLKFQIGAFIFSFPAQTQISGSFCIWLLLLFDAKLKFGTCRLFRRHVNVNIRNDWSLLNEIIHLNAQIITQVLEFTSLLCFTSDGIFVESWENAAQCRKIMKKHHFLCYWSLQVWFLYNKWWNLPDQLHYFSQYTLYF